jgi:hypothetical protein
MQAKGFAAAVAVLGWVLAVGAQTQAPVPVQGVLPEPIGESGEAIYPAFEGWGPLKDGTNVLLIGYFNRNKSQEPDIPVGPNNRIEPGGPDFGQPTHFHTGRQHGVFAIPLPKDFGTKRLTWTIVANGISSSVAVWMNPAYWIDFFQNTANANEPPIIKFSPTGGELTGPPKERFDQTLDARVGQPVALSLWAADKPPNAREESIPNPDGRGAAARGRGDAGRGRGRGADVPAIIGGAVITGGRGGFGGGGGGRGNARGDINVLWKKYRGPGDVKVADQVVSLTNKGDAKLFLEAKTTATFSQPGEYWLRAQVNDSSGDGGGGDQCCWTTAHVRVMVK